MTAKEAAEVIQAYLAGDKSLKARVKKDGELIDYQPLLIANAKEQEETTVAKSATVEDIATSEVVGNQDEQTEEEKVSEAETLAASTSEEGTVYTGVLFHSRQEARCFCTEAEARDYLMQSKKGTHIEVLVPGEARISGFRDTVNGDLERYKGNVMKKASRARNVSVNKGVF